MPMLGAIRTGMVSIVTGVALVAVLPGTASAAAVRHGHWALNETSGDVAVDSSGFGNHGTSFDVGLDGEAYTFNGTSSRVIVPDTSPTAPGSLDPGSRNFSFGVTISMPAPPEQGETYDVLRKGLSSTRGGNYKVEVKHARGKAVARCVVRDSARVGANIQSLARINLAGTGVHTIVCTKTSTGVTIRVDGGAPRTKSVTKLGSVSNTANLALGAKAEGTATTGFDWYRGKIHDAWVSVG
jgi:hypothetical protein